MIERTSAKLKLLFLCTANSCRSQIAEGWTRHLKADSIQAWSAGTHPKKLDPRAVRAMAEAGVDIGNHSSKHIDEIDQREFDYVITVCDAASQACPVFPGQAKVIHAGFDDPPKLASSAHSDEEAMDHYRRVRDEIRAFVEQLPHTLDGRSVNRAERDQNIHP